MEGHRGTTYRGDIAIDDVTITCENPSIDLADTTSNAGDTGDNLTLQFIDLILE